ncbi:MAG: M28 family peptidase [bacterium]|nr:M28 family peptidase [bacterium]
MRNAVLLSSFFLLSFSLRSQDSLYTRSVLRYLCSQDCYGRGYVKDGLHTAETILVKELKKQQISPLFDGSYTQSFFHPVNTFPKSFEVTINGKKLSPGVDFIPNAGNPSCKGKFKVQRIDSLTFVNNEANPPIHLLLKEKLTFTVAKKVTEVCELEIDRHRFTAIPLTIEINIQNKFVNEFESRNIGCKIKGSSPSDSMIVFTAHYDHLGGIGKKTFFPGANDNASGVSMVLNLIRYYIEHPPKYNTVFVLFAGEEAGLLGSKFFVENPPFNLKKIKFLVNLDLLGTGDEGIMVVNGVVYEKEFALLGDINSKAHLLPSIKKRGKAANSDHYWFSEAGVPCFFIYTMGGIKAYHDVYDVEKTLPLTKYMPLFQLITAFVCRLQ